MDRSEICLSTRTQLVPSVSVRSFATNDSHEPNRLAADRRPRCRSSSGARSIVWYSRCLSACKFNGLSVYFWPFSPAPSHVPSGYLHDSLEHEPFSARMSTDGSHLTMHPNDSHNNHTHVIKRHVVEQLTRAHGRLVVRIQIDWWHTNKHGVFYINRLQIMCH